jgi:hypothetical protein
MAPRESQKRASLKWDKENMTVLSCKIRKEQAVAFKAHCEIQGSTSNTVLKDFVLGCIGEQELGTAPETPQEALGRPTRAEGISLHPQALKTVQEAAEATGEAVPQFVERAVETQAKWDKSSLALGINPATGEKLDKEG